MRGRILFAAILLSAILLSVGAFTEAAHAQQLLCIKNQLTAASNRSVPHRSALRVTNNRSCPRGYRTLLSTNNFKGDTGASGAAGAQGAQGAQGEAGPQGSAGAAGTSGADGLDGAIRVYGDGSEGDLTWTGSGSIHGVVTNLQFEDVVVNSGATLTVPSGTTIRCTGTFTNNGSIVVETGSIGGFFNTSNYDATATISARQPAAGLAISAGLNAQIGDDNPAFVRLGGTGGGGISAHLAYRLIGSDSWQAGSGGGASFSRFGGGGGGFLRILCRGGIVNNGSITAEGADSINGAGGGGGGIVLLASQASVQNSNSGVISVQGGDGGAATTVVSNGGGGGGVVFFLAPTVTDTGSVDFNGGAAGLFDAGVPVTANPRSGGGGGGSLFGGGGTGGLVDNSDGSAAGAGAGGNGAIISILKDPTAPLI